MPKKYFCYRNQFQTAFVYSRSFIQACSIYQFVAVNIWLECLHKTFILHVIDRISRNCQKQLIPVLIINPTFVPYAWYRYVFICKYSEMQIVFVFLVSNNVNKICKISNCTGMSQSFIIINFTANVPVIKVVI